MKKVALFVAALCCASPVMAHEEELAPGYNECMQKADGVTSDMIDCINAANMYWDKKLNENYKKAKAGCADADNPKQCEQTLVKAQRLWIQYREAMLPVFDIMGGGGSMSRVAADQFFAEETKKQAQILSDE